jgi:hypothetical protein
MIDQAFLGQFGAHSIRVTGQFDPTDFDDSHRQDAKHPELRI